MTESASKATIKSSKIQQCSYVYCEKKKNKGPYPHAITLRQLPSVHKCTPYSELKDRFKKK
jgi:hypothetical protein